MIQNDIILLAAELVLSVGLFVLAGIAAKFISPKWRLCYAAPALFCIVMLAAGGFEKYMLGVYIGAVLMLAGFFSDKAGLRRISSAAAALGAVFSLTLCISAKDYRATDYAADFEKGFRIMSEHYVLAQHKGIDWDALYEEYLPKFKHAAANNDELENLTTWWEFCAEFKDGHVGYISDDDSLQEKAEKALAGNDYGLSMMTLSSGQTAAVNVDETLAELGIHNGTIILTWDGEKPENLAERSLFFTHSQFADNENREFYRAVFAAGVGGESVTVRFVDDSGAEQTAVLQKLGNYRERLCDTLETVNQGLKAGHMTWTELDEKTVCLRIKTMAYDGRSSKSQDFSDMRWEIEQKLWEYNDRGFDKLILDLRSNGGGSGIMVRTIAEILAPAGEHYYCTDGKWDDDTKSYVTDDSGKFVPDRDNLYKGDDMWQGKDIVILVNSDSASASDHLVKVMRGFDNVTVMGFTKSNGSAQGVGSVALESGMLGFSSSLVLNRDGSVMVDAGTDGISGSDVDVRVPFDKEAVRVLFDEEEDYIMKCAMDFGKSG